MPRIEDYASFVGQKEINYTKALAEEFKGLRVHVVSNRVNNGAAAETLNAMGPLFKSLGIDFRLSYLGLPEDYKKLCDELYSSLKQKQGKFPNEKLKMLALLASKMPLSSLPPCDVLIMQDIAPLPLLPEGQGVYKKAVWWCNSDFTDISENVYHFVKHYVDRYDAAAFSLPQFFIHTKVFKACFMPAIDPLSDKNKTLPESFINEVFARHRIPRDKKIITQIGRFSKTKDPLGALEIFEQVKRDHDCTLVLAGELLAGSKEEIEIYHQLKKRAENVPDAHVVKLPHSSLEVNALQTGSDIIMQKSVKEAFGLGVTEAMWKGKPVVVADTGGMSFQVQDRISGFVCPSKRLFVERLKTLLDNKEMAESFGNMGHMTVRENFIIVRQVRDILILIQNLFEN